MNFNHNFIFNVYQKNSFEDLINDVCLYTKKFIPLLINRHEIIKFILNDNTEKLNNNCYKFIDITCFEFSDYSIKQVFANINKL